MNNTQGLNPINGQMSYREEASNTAPTNSPRLGISELIEQKLHIDGNSLAMDVLFACHKCDGPLVPSSECTVCKRTSLRKCAKCGHEVPHGHHQSCEFLILFRQLRSSRLEQKMNKEVKS
jgi:hypothetical protein